MQANSQITAALMASKIPEEMRVLVSSCRLLSLPSQDSGREQELVLIRTLPGLTPGTGEGRSHRVKCRCYVLDVSCLWEARLCFWLTIGAPRQRPSLPECKDQSPRVLHTPARSCSSELSAGSPKHAKLTGEAAEPDTFPWSSGHACHLLPGCEAVEAGSAHLPARPPAGREKQSSPVFHSPVRSQNSFSPLWQFCQDCHGVRQILPSQTTCLRDKKRFSSAPPTDFRGSLAEGANKRWQMSPESSF